MSQESRIKTYEICLPLQTGAKMRKKGEKCEVSPADQ